jgi:predicted transcriptional regulator
VPKPNPEQVAKIKELHEKGLTQTQVAEILGCTQTNISKISRRVGIIFTNRRDQYGPNNSQYKNGLGRSTIERLTGALVIKSGRSLFICERCGDERKDGFEHDRHHKDRDRTNNTAENIEVVCTSCHMKIHNAMRNRDGNGRFID